MVWVYWNECSALWCSATVVYVYTVSFEPQCWQPHSCTVSWEWGCNVGWVSHVCHMTIVVFFLPVWTQVLTLTISRMMSCGWTLNTPMGKGSVQYSLLWSVYVVSSPDSYWGSGNEACIWCELVGCFVLSRYFTWDTAKFPNSAGMINNLAAKGRKVWECLQVKT